MSTGSTGPPLFTKLLFMPCLRYSSKAQYVRGQKVFLFIVLLTFIVLYRSGKSRSRAFLVRTFPFAYFFLVSTLPGKACAHQSDVMEGSASARLALTAPGVVTSQLL